MFTAQAIGAQIGGEVVAAAGAAGAMTATACQKSTAALSKSIGWLQGG